ncbi:MAG: EGF domain-containing protein [Bradymonadia bacterium]
MSSRIFTRSALLAVAVFTASCGDPDNPADPSIYTAQEKPAPSDLEGEAPDATPDPGPTGGEPGPTVYDPETNTPPTLAIMGPDMSGPLWQQAPLTIEVQVGDAETPTEALAVTAALSMDAQVPWAISTPGADGRVTLTSDQLPQGSYTVSLTVTDPVGDSASEAVDITVLPSPDRPVVVLAPEQPTGADDIEVVMVEAPTVEGAGDMEMALQYRWAVSGREVDVYGPVLSSSWFQRGDQVRVWVDAFLMEMGSQTGSTATASVWIGDAPLATPEVQLFPSAPTVADTVSCEVINAPLDPDGALETYTYAWTFDGEPLPEATEPTLALASVVGGVWQPRYDVRSGGTLACVVTVAQGAITLDPVVAEAALQPFDACATPASGCSPVGATCANTDRAEADCACAPGYVGDGTTCDDEDECVTGNHDCGPGATCTNTFGGFECSCPEGFTGDPQVACTDTDECAEGSANCAALATCTNTPGGFECTCVDGTIGDGFTCDDVDECTSGAAACAFIATCTNTAPGYTCTCPDGFQGDGTTCDDIDECADDDHSCHADAICTNARGGYTCECAPGYTGDGTTCDDIDECARGLDNCGDGSTCENTPGGFTCSCPDGFTDVGGDCVDVDECATGSHDCGAHAQCQNIPGGFRCLCEQGYADADGACVDVDECATGQFVCDPNARCQNTDGSYTCACNAGFEGNGKVCTDIDECQQNPGCSPFGFCNNTPGGFECVCGPGFQGDGYTCD